GFTGERRGSLRMLFTDKLKDIFIEHSGMVDFSKVAEAFSVTVPMEKGGSTTAAASIYGDPDLPFWAAGQGVGLIDKILPCGDVVRKIMEEADRAQQKIQGIKAV
ncbi:MAG: hypothetical protein JW821_19970, partial [Deltaproteobacteria bacterium]|nr:hypothetical protein [Deltaproteobacteria bacterium]